MVGGVPGQKISASYYLTLLMNRLASARVCLHSNVLCLSMCLSSSCSKFCGLLVGSSGECLLECHVDAHGGLGDR